MDPEFDHNEYYLNITEEEVNIVKKKKRNKMRTFFSESNINHIPYMELFSKTQKQTDIFILINIYIIIT